jgi:hypothetical protein
VEGLLGSDGEEDVKAALEGLSAGVAGSEVKQRAFVERFGVVRIVGLLGHGSAGVQAKACDVVRALTTNCASNRVAFGEGGVVEGGVTHKAFIFITGITGLETLQRCNGLYDLTNQTFNGYPVYVNRSDRGLYLVHRNGDWEIKQSSEKDSDGRGAAFVQGGCPLEACVSRVWKVNGHKGFIDQPSVNIVLGEEGERQVKCSYELARTGKPSLYFLHTRAGR